MQLHLIADAGYGGPVPLGTKTCRKCKQVKPHSEFYSNIRTSDGRHAYCRVCASGMKREAYARWTPEKRHAHRRRVIKYRYGVDVDLVDALYERHEGCCVICGRSGERPFASERRHSKKGVLCIDHDHETGEVRGLLCFGCNTALGNLQDNPALMVRAADYVLRRGAI